jgi:hypothetical protein
MGKKSRLKRERRVRGPEKFTHLLTHRQKSSADIEASFERACQSLSELFSKFCPEDVFLSLGVSDLWLPNISSQVKHHLAWGIAASIAPREYEGQKIETYSEFADFIVAVHAILPSFSYLEDFLPEPDWGGIRLASEGSYLNIFYGSNVERIPDFVDAFRLLRSEEPMALRDIDAAIALQNHAIVSVRPGIVGQGAQISPGHVETPSQAFWWECRTSLQDACNAISDIETLSPELVLELGTFKRPKTSSSFGDAVMQGTSLPALVIRMNGRMLPVSLRCATSVVIDLWAGKDNELPSDSSSLVRLVSRFVAQRVARDKVVTGPLRLTSPSARIEQRLTAVLNAGDKFYFLVMLAAEEIPSLADFEREVRQLLDSGEEWALILEGRGQGMQFRRKDGKAPGSSDIEIMAILTSVTTSWMPLELPETGARVLALTDFVSIFDSLKDLDELNRFWTYVDSYSSIMGFMSGTADLFASFRDSNALLVDGADEPTMISLDPHWGSNWRYKELTNFWRTAPPQFPDGELSWVIEEKSDGIQRMIAKGSPTLAWSTRVDKCVVQTILEVFAQDLDTHNGRLLELFVHCLIDTFSQRSELIRDSRIFVRRQVVIYCRANAACLASVESDVDCEAKSKLPLLDGWTVRDTNGDAKLWISVDVNLSRLQTRLDSPQDASFEVECLVDTMVGLAQLLNQPQEPQLVSAVANTSSRLPRFTLKRVRRPMDVPDYSNPKVPQPEQYKVARRDLAIVLKAQGVTAPGRYELSTAKQIIDSARDAMRHKLHERIATLDRSALILFCIEQHDELTAEYQREIFRIKQSLNHEVSFDRSHAIAEANDRFTHGARNYRYLLECRYSSLAQGDVVATAPVVVQLVASIDWLFVLYGASDVLHNGIEPAGIELDHSFVPEVFYSGDREAKERQFSHEMARAKLGIDLIQEDEVNSSLDSGDEWAVLDGSFDSDLGFSLTSLLHVLHMLSRWHEVGGDSELRFCYRASPAAIVAGIAENIEGISEAGARRILEFLTLDPASVRRLLGKEVDESDVPVWEHSKRGSRYTIRPLIKIDEETVAWGAASASRASSIWTGTISNGYLPADFNWPRVKAQVRAIKEGLEKQLETQAFKICSRHAVYVLEGIDFKYRFPKQQFEDVGDFDVLMYWPESNHWLSVECKYNQPPYCLKDARRLRERIFGKKDRGQFAKIEGRRAFLCKHLDRLRALVDWPAPHSTRHPSFTEAYVSRDIYWWMRNPPYEVPTHFVRIDALDGWLRTLSGDFSQMTTEVQR